MRTKRPDVYLISLDSVRTDTFLNGDYPNLRMLQRNGTLFSHTTSPAPLTPVSHSSVLTGLYPANHGVRHLFREPLPADIQTIAQVFQKAGYATGAFAASAGLHHWYGLSRGFDLYSDQLPTLPDGRDPLEVVDVATRGSAYVKGEVIVQRALNWLGQVSQTDRPLFAFIHLFDAHWPYSPPEPWATRYSGHLYAGEIAYMDHCLQAFLEHVDTDASLVVVFSDHGEDLGEHGGPGSANPQEMGHGALLHENTLRVFMLFTGLSIPAQEVTHQVRLLDLAPTLLELVGLEPIPSIDGQSLVPIIQGGPAPELSVAYSETFFPEELDPELGIHPPLCSVKLQVRDRLLKVVWQISESGQVAVYDLDSDPNERFNLLDRAI